MEENLTILLMCHITCVTQQWTAYMISASHNIMNVIVFYCLVTLFCHSTLYNSVDCCEYDANKSNSPPVIKHKQLQHIICGWSHEIACLAHAVSLTADRWRAPQVYFSPTLPCANQINCSRVELMATWPSSWLERHIGSSVGSVL